jgi:hypothetical protein
VGGTHIERRFATFDLAAGAPPGASRTTDHLARLLVKATVEERILAGRLQEAIDLASEFRLVTPVTGAVVLETQRDYEAAGLEAVAPSSVPTVTDPIPSAPEPEVLWLALVAGLALLVIGARRR